jgi:hypothetical protein
MNYIIKEHNAKCDSYFFVEHKEGYENIEDVKEDYDDDCEVVEVDIDWDTLLNMDNEELEEAFNQHSYKP